MSGSLIIGATSAIAEATARLLAERGGSLYLVGRNAARLEAIAADLTVRGASSVAMEAMDLNEFVLHGPMIERAFAALGRVDSVLIAHGTLSDQPACERSVAQALAEISTNALSVVALLTLLANRFETERRGVIVVVSSVAGDRGRASNYVYGSAKALVTVFCSGLRQRLASAGVCVITVKPGFVDTPMTRRCRKGFIWAKPPAVARGIVRAMDRRRGTVYLPAFWRPIMLAVRLIPEPLFTRMRL
jgi:decaprenylphospho-beta-D-erythro-pentofuranosid-2-ulose 2-reductase